MFGFYKVSHCYTSIYTFGSNYYIIPASTGFNMYSSLSVPLLLKTGLNYYDVFYNELVLLFKLDSICFYSPFISSY